MANSRTWMLYNMRAFGKKEYTDSEIKCHKEIIDNCFGSDVPLNEIVNLIKTQYLVRNMHEVDGIRPTIPPPKLDIAIPSLKIAIRVNGGIHEGRRQRLKDEDQLTVLECNGWTVINVDFKDREDLWN